MSGFGQLLRKFREDRNIGQGTLAGCIDVAQTFLSDVENGRRRALSADKIKRCQKALSLSEDETDALYLAAAIDRGAVDITNKSDAETLGAVIWLLRETATAREAATVSAAAFVINAIKRLDREQQSEALSAAVAAVQSGRVEAA